ncbi:ankyrin repeat-containing domain protein [Ochromonadaceae sp. CCMP2298]|nr:ankyrin repeat-containing domain protein [Ochromonadaceae sp. CCMP2298]|mmetsp:Transcript_13926/g.30727  ORF Transcript_13926/g.30727 Transcript_13926/m.30727 type:complete len:252 (+) Transcript_13926:130-885(+)
MDIGELSMMLETLEVKTATEEEFQAAVAKAKSLSNVVPEQQIILYGLFKQCTVGDVSVPSPGEADVIAKHKWDAWKAFQGFPASNARLAYVYIVEQLLSAGPGGPGSNGFGAIVSTLNCEYDATLQWAPSEAVFQCVTDGDLEALRKYVLGGDSVNVANEEKMTPLHFAADRGHSDISEFLLQNGANVDAVDSSGQTALMYAVACEYKDVVEILLRFKADLSIRNSEGIAVMEMEDIDAEISALFQAHIKE